MGNKQELANSVTSNFELLTTYLFPDTNTVSTAYQEL